MAMINSIVDPEQDRIAEQMAQAAALRKQMFAPNTGGGYQGGKVFMVGSPLGNIAQTLAGVYLGEKGREEQQALSDTRNSQLKQALAAMPGLTNTTPVYGPTPEGGNLPDITTPKPYQQVIDERQKWAAGMGDIRHPLAQAISQSAMLQGISAPEKLLEQENQLKLAREKLAADNENRKSDQEWKRMFGMTNLDIKQQMVDIARDKANQPNAADLKRQDAQEAALKGKENLTNTVQGINDTLDQLDALGGTVNTNKSGFSNLGSRVASSALGQAMGKTFGTKEQELRDVLSNSQLALLNDIKAANPGISSKQIDSNAELRTWLASLGDATQSVQARKQTLANIVSKYGQPGAFENSTLPSAAGGKAAAGGGAKPQGVAPTATVVSRVQLKDGGTGILWSDGSRTRE